ncbi:MAG: type II toxin-antitoxin system RelE/ParE family toxin [Candidatus Scalindua sp.]|nr:type II toxin-antitoxin system RelE/ParE family toxin [Candidatus Scalindua sp.]
MAQAKILARIRRASFGNFGDWKKIKGTKGIFEMREHYRQGYRILYTVVKKKLVLLLAGSTKKDQKKNDCQGGRIFG